MGLVLVGNGSAQSAGAAMSDHPEQAVERAVGLLGTDDPEVWATEFCRIFDGQKVHAVETEGTVVDPSTMTGWFANAMQTAINIGRSRERRIKESQATAAVPDTAREAFVTGVEDGREGPTDFDDPTKT